MKKTLVIILFFALIVTSCRLVVAADNPPNLRGPAFTDPDMIFPMPQKWRDQPVVHDKQADGADLFVTLDQQLYPLLLPIINNFATQQQITIKTQEGTCGISAGQLLKKNADIGGFCCPAGENDRLPGLVFHTLGIAPLRIIVHPDNPINNLSLTQVRQIFQGKITNWHSLPGFGNITGNVEDTIRPIARLHCKIRPGHWRLLLDNEDLFSPRVQEVGSIHDMLAEVGMNKYALGYEVLFHINRHRSEFKIKSLTIDHHDPSNPEDVLSLAYPLYRTLNITSWNDETKNAELTRQLIEYIKANTKEPDSRFEIIPAWRLREAGWQFREDELIGEPR